MTLTFACERPPVRTHRTRILSDEIIAYARKHPEAGNERIAEALNTTPVYVRRVLALVEKTRAYGDPMTIQFYSRRTLAIGSVTVVMRFTDRKALLARITGRDEATGMYQARVLEVRG